MRKIKYLYWWNTKPNVGDSSSKYIVEWMLDHKVIFAEANSIFKEIKIFIRELVKYRRLYKFRIPLNPRDKVLYAVGTIIDNVGSKAIIWGSGLSRTYSRIKGHPQIYAVRGYLTKNNLPAFYCGKRIAVGDPAVLLPLIFKKEKSTPRHLVGLIPHFEEYEYYKEHYGDRFKIIDIRTTDVSSFIDGILDCKYILSTAMHGIIISHSYGIPALWIRRLEVNVGDFKFHDYFSSVDIPIYDGFTDIDAVLDGDIQDFFKKNIKIAYVDPVIINRVQNELIKSFPKEYD